ncbi:hypothetical protein Pmar_PMAR025366 [Perkinsus marinus ATCC 50983]|uniref:Secreted protein n=1 Tax=Perkinsus marinus (strain ATCC 50983 / TXsc) TaxID=423536 RepID=C5KS41_PERM5|nr:hypothetical protein Pmar_PMAR025366 [Perkinsus marinus ATCC 50983]EER12732.1 hypothetical protein Pmar_PMAR025366 [Perkinsus marinus ATCC 50983]|eukprot:XP_002780937.1 hypothetical protein Pmar_PMAR025366 [Perkinsus marinus ATCC 50983]
MSPHLLQSLFTIFSSLSSIIADEVVSKFDTRIQVLREVVAVCAETSSEEETLKRHHTMMAINNNKRIV